MKIITPQILEFLQNKEFINVGSCDFDGRPNVAPKFLLAIENNFIYLVDYVLGRTYHNIKINPKVSLSTVNLQTLIGYQINGDVEMIDQGPVYTSLLKRFHDKQISFSTKRIIEGVRGQKSHESFELTFPEKVVIFKINVYEIVEIGPSGKLERKKT